MSLRIHSQPFKITKLDFREFGDIQFSYLEWLPRNGSSLAAQPTAKATIRAAIKNKKERKRQSRLSLFKVVLCKEAL